LEQAGNFRRLAVKQRRKLPQLFGVTESDNLQRNRKCYLGLLHQRAEDAAHLLEMQGHITAAFLAGVSNHRKIRRADFYPLRFPRMHRLNHEGNNRQGQRATEAPEANRHFDTLKAPLSYTSSSLLVTSSLDTAGRQFPSPLD